MKKILVVEDNLVNLELVTQLLEDDYAISTATDGNAGVARAQQLRPDLILMDLSLPGLDGWETTRRLRSDPALARTPIVALSAHAARADIERALDAGCDAYVTKPIDEDELKQTITRLLKSVEGAR
jgi:two-component system, cell cycle response regulator DivK